MRKKDESEKLIKKILIKKEIVPETNIKNVSFIDVNIKNEKIDKIKIEHNAKLIITGEYEMNSKIGVKLDFQFGEIIIEKFLTKLDRIWGSAHPMILIAQR